MSSSIQKACLCLFFGVILSVGIADAVLSWKGQKPPDNASEPNMPRPVFRLKLLWTGEWTPACEAWLKNRSWLVHGTAAKYRELVFQYAQRSPNGVVVGKNDWLFQSGTVALRTTAGNQAEIAKAVAKLSEFNLRYQAMGMRMVILLIPNAANLFPEQTPDWIQNEKERRAFLPEITSRLQASGILVFNSTDAMKNAAEKGKKVFFKGDNHWTYQGAEAACEGLAKFVIASGFGKNDEANSGPIYSVHWTSRFGRKGSWHRKFGFWNGSAMDQRLSDAYEFPEFVQIREPLPGAGWVGTSFSGFGSPEFFANAASMDIERLARPAKGSKFSIGWGLKHFESTASPRPPIVILEIPEYHLTGDSEEGGGFDGLTIGAPPWTAPSVPLGYQCHQTLGLKKKTTSDPGVSRFIATQQKASLRLKLERPVTDLEISVSLSKVRSKVVFLVKGISNSRQICYDSDKMLKYRFSKKTPTATWDIVWSSLESGQIMEIGELRTLTISTSGK